MITRGRVAEPAAVKWWDLAAVTTFTGLRSEARVRWWVYMVLVLISREAAVDSGPMALKGGLECGRRLVRIFFMRFENRVSQNTPSQNTSSDFHAPALLYMQMCESLGQRSRLVRSHHLIFNPTQRPLMI